MFYDKFLKLCADNGVSKQMACSSAGLSSTAWIRWKDGSMPSSVSLHKICNYFSVTPDSMIDNEKEIERTDDGIRARQELFDSTEMRVLFDAAKVFPAYKLYEVASQLMKWKEDNL